MKNNFANRWFLICSYIANEQMEGFIDLNFAKLIIDENNGRFGNNQMTSIFWSVSEALKTISTNVDFSFEEEIDNSGDFKIEEVSKLSTEQLSDYFYEYCEAKINFFKDEKEVVEYETR